MSSRRRTTAIMTMWQRRGHTMYAQHSVVHESRANRCRHGKGERQRGCAAARYVGTVLSSAMRATRDEDHLARWGRPLERPKAGEWERVMLLLPSGGCAAGGGWLDSIFDISTSPQTEGRCWTVKRSAGLWRCLCSSSRLDGRRIGGHISGVNNLQLPSVVLRLCARDDIRVRFDRRS